MPDVYVIEHTEIEFMTAHTSLVAVCATLAAARQHIETNVAIQLAEGPPYLKSENREAVREALRRMYEIKQVPCVTNGSAPELTGPGGDDAAKSF